MLKATPPEDDETHEEPDALDLWGGDGAVRLLRQDVQRRVMLLDRASPGSDLAAVDDDDATEIAVSVVTRLRRPASTPFRSIGDPVPRCSTAPSVALGAGRWLLPLARRLYEELDVDRSILVHGDFHHHNLVAHGARYVAIDRKPMVGEPEYDVASFL